MISKFRSLGRATKQAASAAGEGATAALMIWDYLKENG
jgi:thioredoxin reductase